jgi:DNA-binding GntR family transcriptional regulator
LTDVQEGERVAAPRRGGELVDALPEGVGAGTLPAQIHELLEDAIIHGVLEPGQRLQTDKLAARYGVSRIPVREALRSLHEAGWVDIRPRYGVYVRERSEEELQQLFEARSVIEGSIAGWAADRHRTADLRTLRRVVGDSEKAAKRGDEQALDRLGREFYAAMRAAAGNDVVAAVAANLEKRARFYFSMVAGDLGADWVSVHRELLSLVHARDSSGAEALSRRHILDTGRAVAALLAAQEATTEG